MKVEMILTVKYKGFILTCMCVTQTTKCNIIITGVRLVRVKCLVQEHSMVNSARASSFLECSKWIEAH